MFAVMFSISSTNVIAQHICMLTGRTEWNSTMYAIYPHVCKDVSRSRQFELVEYWLGIEQDVAYTVAFEKYVKIHDFTPKCLCVNHVP